MLVINADDWGASEETTNVIQECIEGKTVDSVSAMVFMKDSERAADILLYNGYDSGLHLNFTTPFDGFVESEQLIQSQNRVIAYLRSSKIAQFVFNPLLNNDFDYLVKAQCEEYFRIYQSIPARIDGHNHMHLCANMLMGDFIPHNIRVRRNNSFEKGEKSMVNRAYRALVDKLLAKRYICTDFFYHIQQISHLEGNERTQRLEEIMALSHSSNIELLTHPHQKFDYDYLSSEEFSDGLSRAARGNFQNLSSVC